NRRRQEVFADSRESNGSLPSREQQQKQDDRRRVLAPQGTQFRHARRVTTPFIASNALISSPHIAVRLTDALVTVKARMICEAFSVQRGDPRAFVRPTMRARREPRLCRIGDR